MGSFARHWRSDAVLSRRASVASSGVMSPPMSCTSTHGETTSADVIVSSFGRHSGLKSSHRSSRQRSFSRFGRFCAESTFTCSRVGGSAGGQSRNGVSTAGGVAIASAAAPMLLRELSSRMAGVGHCGGATMRVSKSGLRT